jgi:hypothetical protein
MMEIHFTSGQMSRIAEAYDALANVLYEAGLLTESYSAKRKAIQWRHALTRQINTANAIGLASR